MALVPANSLHRHDEASEPARADTRKLSNTMAINDGGQLSLSSRAQRPDPGQPRSPPVEIWERIVDELAEGYRYREYALWDYGRVCRAWFLRCRFHAQRGLALSNRRQVHSFARMTEVDPCRREAVRMVRIDDHIDILGPFSATMAQKLPRVEMLTLRGGRWKLGQMHCQIFLQVSAAFQSITVLVLYETGFPSVAIFGRLVAALPHLTNLICWDLKFKSSTFTLGCVHLPKSLALSRLELQGSSEVIEFLTTTSICATLRCIALKDCNEVLGPVYQRLVDLARTSLSSVDIRPSPHSGDWQDIPLDLSIVENLEMISLHLSFHQLSQQSSTPAAILSRVSPAKLREVKITTYSFDLDECLLEGLFGAFDESRAQVDQILSGPRYTALTAVTFELLACIHLADIRKVPTAKEWRAHLISAFPELHAKQLLRTPVMVRIREMV
ncbi:uncharacterized protein FIBRA_07541 [Fibroporia radiculosa]|uniref:F-box domain-containing protein n=1 Tax=Fibroporia radiculosa TaxID=599839 RepID=J4I0V4_9APHY|nr:uncharacterized protein FIBRA_07541 [Fibroporia radiculosa]CCM05327.1 predicted protein [Fibroporia radiculosa]